MTLWKGLLLALVMYLTADYCDPSIPGVFFFDTESYFVESVESRAVPRPMLLVTSGPLPAREFVAPLQATPPSRPRPRLQAPPSPPQRHALKTPPASPAGVDDH